MLDGFSCMDLKFVVVSDSKLPKLSYTNHYAGTFFAVLNRPQLNDWSNLCMLFISCVASLSRSSRSHQAISAGCMLFPPFPLLILFRCPRPEYMSVLLCVYIYLYYCHAQQVCVGVCFVIVFEDGEALLMELQQMTSLDIDSICSDDKNNVL